MILLTTLDIFASSTDVRLECSDEVLVSNTILARICMEWVQWVGVHFLVG